MPPARVVAVAPGSPAASTGIQPGDEVLALNGEAVRDDEHFAHVAAWDHDKVCHTEQLAFAKTTPTRRSYA